MSLSNALVSQLVEVANTTSNQKQDAIVYGTIVKQGDSNYVKLDGAELLTPVSSTTVVKDGERVTVMIKNHKAIITGNLTSPSAQDDDLKDIITEVGILIADKVSTEELEAEKGRIDDLVTDNILVKETLEATKIVVGDLEADNVVINEKLTATEIDVNNLKTDKLDAKVADITFATIKDLEVTDANVHNLTADYGEFKELTTDSFIATDALIEKLDTTKLSAEQADLKYANIDFSNIGKAAMEEFYSKSGLIENVIIGDGTITGTLAGVTIIGEMIKGGTIVADKLVILGTDGLYYKLNTDGITTEAEQTDENSLNGQIITAKSITATKISVSDLVAFDATIGGFKITEGSLYSGVKESVNNTTRGVYLDSSGQLSLGDSDNFLKYFKDEDGIYKLKVSAGEMLIGTSKTNVEVILGELDESKVIRATEAPEDPVEGMMWMDVSNTNNPMLYTWLQTGEGEDELPIYGWVPGNDYELLKQLQESYESLTSDEWIASITNTILNSDGAGEFVKESELKASLQVLSNQINATLEEMSGYNLILNSVGWNGVTFWDLEPGGSIESVDDNDVVDNTLSGHAFKMNSSKMEQSVKINIGNTYTISFLYRKHLSIAKVLIYQGGIETVILETTENYVDDEWREASLTFIGTEKKVIVSVESSGDFFMISDLIINDGPIKKQWTSHTDEIYTTGVRIDKTGISIEQSDTDTIVKINSKEFSVVDKISNEVVLRVNQDTTELEKLNCRGTTRVGKLMMVPIGDRVDFVIMD